MEARFRLYDTQKGVSLGGAAYVTSNTQLRAAGHRIGTAPLPVGMVDRGIFIKGQAGVINHLEQAAALQIAAHGGGNDA